MATDRGRETVAVVKVVAMEEEGEAEVRVAVGRWRRPRRGRRWGGWRRGRRQ